jgi:peptidoglycan/LPS O-acetylase OafA/YrhL
LGSIAVLLFFAVSGFVVTEAAATIYAGRPVAFITNRFLRIYPTYLLAVVATVAVLTAIAAISGRSTGVEEWTHVPRLSVESILANVFGILPGGGFLLASAHADFILGIAWALQIELLFYFALFALMFASALSGVGLGRILAGTGLLAMAAYAYLLPSLRGGGLEYVPYFVLGVALYYAVSPKSNNNAAWVAIGMMCAAVILVVVDLLGKDPVHQEYNYTRALFGQVCIFILAIVAWIALTSLLLWTKRIPENIIRWDRAIGEMTYPLYLLHIPTLILLVWLSLSRGVMALVLGFIVSIAVSWIAYQLFETRVALLRARVRGLNLASLYA